MTTIFNENGVEVKLTGRTYDFFAVVENNNKKKVTVRDKAGFLEDLTIPAGDWVGLLYDLEGTSWVDKFEYNEVDIL